MPKTNKHPLTIKEVASRENVCPMTVYRWTWAGVKGVVLQTVTRGSRVLVRESDLARFHHEIQQQRRLARQRVQAAVKPKRRRVSAKARERLQATHGIS